METICQCSVYYMIPLKPHYRYGEDNNNNTDVFTFGSLAWVIFSILSIKEEKKSVEYTW